MQPVKPRAVIYECKKCHKKWIDTQAKSLFTSGYSHSDVAKAVFAALFMLATFLYFMLDLLVDFFWFLSEQTNLTLKLLGLLGSIILIFTVVIPASKKDKETKRSRLIEATPDNIANHT